MPRLSVRISDHLHEQLLERGRHMGTDNVSDAIRLLLLWALQHQDSGSGKTDMNTLFQELKSYSVMSHCLLEEGFVSLVEGGAALKDKALEKARKMIEDSSEKTS